MIDKDLLLSTGTVDALVAIATDGPHTTNELTDPTGLSDTTVRERMDELRAAGLVEAEAEMRDDSPVKVFVLTDQGKKVASSVRTLIGATPPVEGRVERAESETAEDSESGSVSDSSGDEGDGPADEEIKPSGTVLAGDSDGGGDA